MQLLIPFILCSDIWVLRKGFGLVRYEAVARPIIIVLAFTTLCVACFLDSRLEKKFYKMGTLLSGVVKSSIALNSLLWMFTTIGLAISY